MTDEIAKFGNLERESRDRDDSGALRSHPAQGGETPEVAAGRDGEELVGAGGAERTGTESPKR